MRAADGTLHLSNRPVGFRQVGMEGGCTGLDGDGPSNEVDGLLVIALLMGDDAEQMQGVGLNGVPIKNALVSTRRLIQLTV